MNITTLILPVVLVLIFAGIITAVILTRRTRTEKLHTKYGAEYQHTVESQGSEQKAQTELQERERRVEALGIHPLSLV